MVTFQGKQFSSWKEAREATITPVATAIATIVAESLPKPVAVESFSRQSLPKAVQPKSLVEKYRPRRLADLVGQDTIVATLRQFVAKPKSRAFLLAGSSGVGKTAAAWALAGELGCDIDSEEMGGVTTIPAGEQSAASVRQCADRLWLCPMLGSGWKVVIVNETDGMSPAAENIWLDVIGEGRLPDKCVIVFSTNYPEKLSDRFCDRCGMLLEFKSTADDLMPAAKMLAAAIWRAERPNVEPDAEIINTVVAAANRRGQMSFRRVVNGMAELLGE